MSCLVRKHKEYWNDGMSSVNSHTCYDDVHVNFDLVGKSNNGDIILRGKFFTWMSKPLDTNSLSSQLGFFFPLHYIINKRVEYLYLVHADLYQY